MAKCPYCSEPAVAWRMWRVTRWSGYRCGGCRRISRVPGAQLSKLALWFMPIFVANGFLCAECLRRDGPYYWTEVGGAAIAVGALMGWAMKRWCELVPEHEATAF